MNLSPIITDNIAELLAKIFDFTERRREILMRNITEVAEPDFVPHDLDVEEFSELMMQAISEHVRSERLLLCDSETIKFGREGSFESFPVVDEQSKQLLGNDMKEYMNLQVEKLSENLLNQKIAVEFLRQKQSKGQPAGRLDN
jgi:flagellar basal body rod protein FlgB